MEKNNYSIDMMKKSIFSDEINNYLKIQIKQLQEDPLCNMREIAKLEAIQYFLEDRIEQITNQNK